jgi:hypothetical protein
MEDPVVLIVVVFLVVEMLYSLWCANWMRRRYGRRLMRSAVWDGLIEGQVRTVVAGVIMLGLVIHGTIVYLFDTRFIQMPWGTILLGVAWSAKAMMARVRHRPIRTCYDAARLSGMNLETVLIAFVIVAIVVVLVGFLRGR